jgi:hypothetical protein
MYYPPITAWASQKTSFLPVIRQIFFISPMRAIGPAHLILFDVIALMSFYEEE